MTMSASLIGADVFALNLKEMPKVLRAHILAVLEEEAARLADIVKNEKLEGGVLNRRTGQLQKSIHFGVETEGDVDIGYIGANTDEAKYAAYHEYGFTGTEQVREHVRRISEAFGKPLKTPRDVLVAAHQRKVKYPARSYLRSTLAENIDRIEGRLHQAADDAAVMISRGML